MRKILRDFIDSLPLKCKDVKRVGRYNYLLLECPSCKKDRWVNVNNIRSRIKQGVFTGECIHCTGAKHLKEGTRGKPGWKRSPEEAARIGAKHKNKVVSEETRAKLSANKKAYFETPQGVEQRARKAASMVGKKLSPETREKMSKALLERWKDPEYHHNTVLLLHTAGATIKPTTPEIIMGTILDELYPNEWKYVGDWSLVIGNLNPDFVSVKGNKIVEVWGNYFHEGQNPEERINYFKQHGYETLIIWTQEMDDDFDGMVDKVVAFCEKELAFA